MEKTTLIVECLATNRVGTLVSQRTDRCAILWSNGSTENAAPDSFREIGEISYTIAPHERICCHTSCLKPLAIYHNVRNLKWYCADCARILNSGGRVVCFPVDG
jgi:hypothetical protein